MLLLCLKSRLLTSPRSEHLNFHVERVLFFAASSQCQFFWPWHFTLISIWTRWIIMLYVTLSLQPQNTHCRKLTALESMPFHLFSCHLFPNIFCHHFIFKSGTSKWLFHLCGLLVCPAEIHKHIEQNRHELQQQMRANGIECLEKRHLINFIVFVKHANKLIL